MMKTNLNLLTDTICEMIELSEEEQNFSEVSSESEEETVSLGSAAGTSLTTSTSIYDTGLQSELSGSEQSDSVRYVEDENYYVFGKTDWI
jgi:hypothetical protein